MMIEKLSKKVKLKCHTTANGFINLLNSKI